MKLLKFCAVTLCVLGVILVARSQQSSSGNTYGNQDGRYRLVFDTGTYSRAYVIDTQTGRVWHSTLDAGGKLVVFDPNTYKNIDGELSLVPNELHTGIKLGPPQMPDNTSTNHY